MASKRVSQFTISKALIYVQVSEPDNFFLNVVYSFDDGLFTKEKKTFADFASDRNLGW